MSTQFLLVKAPVAPTQAKTQGAISGIAQLSQLWMVTSVGLALVLIGLAVLSKLQRSKLEKKLKFEQYRGQELHKKLKLALETIRKFETNPDLIHSRDVNLDYIRMRMAEETFHFVIINQIKVKVREKITQTLRPSLAVGVTSSERQVDQIFDVEYEPAGQSKQNKRVLFRIQIRLMRLPTQTTSATTSQIVNCIETYLSPTEDDEARDTWQPTVQGRIMYMHWDQKAKPTPLLVMEQSTEGVNVIFRTKRQALGASPATSEQSSHDASGRSNSTVFI
jgi:hypothetical protein